MVACSPEAQWRGRPRRPHRSGGLPIGEPGDLLLSAPWADGPGPRWRFGVRPDGTALYVVTSGNNSGDQFNVVPLQWARRLHLRPVKPRYPGLSQLVARSNSAFVWTRSAKMGQAPTTRRPAGSAATTTLTTSCRVAMPSFSTRYAARPKQVTTRASTTATRPTHLRPRSL